MKEKTLNVRKIVICILIVLLVLFGIWNGLWLYYRQYRFVRVAEQAGMTKQTDRNGYYLSEVPLGNGMTAHYGVFCPPYLRFSHNYTAFEEPDKPHIEQDGKYIYPCDYRITLTVHPSLFGEPRYYQIQIYDQKTANAQYLAGETNELSYGDIYTFDVDADMNIIREWSYGGQAVWDDAHDDAYAMFTRAKGVFGL